VKPIPISFKIGFLTIHTYGIGLAVTFYIGYKLFERALKKKNYDVEWLSTAFIWIIISAIIGARVVSVVANIKYYSHDWVQVFEIWQGGVSSYGGLVGGFLVGIPIVKRKLPELDLPEALDMVAPILVACWVIGRLLGPQLMYRGGGRRTNLWFGMEYAGEVGKRLPVPIFQSIECTVVLLILLYIVKRQKVAGKKRNYIVVLSAIFFWDITRFFDEFLYLDRPQRLWDAVEVFSLILVAISGLLIIYVKKKTNLVDFDKKRDGTPNLNGLDDDNNIDAVESNSTEGDGVTDENDKNSVNTGNNSSSS
jgi:phosphatidylglycerol:prolipoprotein diacylglycerol transferase